MTQSNALALFGEQTAAMPEYLTRFVSDQGAGNEGVGSDDMALPVLNLLQALSPQLETVDGAKAGQFHNSITDELYEAVHVINLNFEKDFAVFRKRNRGGGFHGSFASKVEADAKVNELGGNAADYDVFETHKHILLLLDAAGVPVQPIMMRMKSTAATVSKKWNAEINVVGQGAARFATVWTLMAKKKTNDQGTWFVPEPVYAGWAPESLYASAKEFFDSVKGKATTAVEG